MMETVELGAFERKGKDGENEIILDVLLNRQNREGVKTIYLDAHKLKGMIETFVRSWVSCAFEATELSDRIEAEVGRKIEVAVKALVPRIEKAVEAEMQKQVTARVAAAVAAMPISVSVQIGGGA